MNNQNDNLKENPNNTTPVPNPQSTTNPVSEPQIIENINTIKPQVIENTVTASPEPTVTPVAPEAPTPVVTPVAPAPTETPAPTPAPAPVTPAPAKEPVAPTTPVAPVTTPEPVPVATPNPEAPATPATPAPATPATPLNVPPNATFGPSGPIGPSNDLTNIGFVANAAPLPKKKNKGLIVAISLVILIGLCAVGYFVVYPYVKRTYLDDPKNVYTETIEGTFKKINASIQNVVHEKAIYDIELSLDSNIQGLTDFSGYKYGLNFGIDPDKKDIQLGYSVKDSQNVEYSAYQYIKNGNAYERFSTYRDDEGRIGLIYLGAANLEGSDELFTSFKQLLDYSQNLNDEELTYLTNKISSTLINSIDTSKLSKEEASITFNGETLKVMNNKYTLDYDNLTRTAKYIEDELKKDDKFIDILVKLMNSDKESITNILSFSEKINDDDETKERVLYINVYTQGLANDIIGYSLTEAKSDDELHYYFDKVGNFEIYLFSKDEDEETGKTVDNKVEITGQKGSEGTNVTVKYNGEDLLILNVSKWDENNIEFTYTIKDADEGDIGGSFKYNKDLNDERLKINLEFSIELKKEYLKLGLKFEEDWTSEVANINTNTASQLSATEIAAIEQKFQTEFMKTPIGILLQTDSGLYSPDVNDYYNSKDITTETDNVNVVVTEDNNTI